MGTRVVRYLGAALAALFVVLSLIGPVSAATTGSISGTVVDNATKKPLAGASVTASAPSGRGTATTDANGFYNIYNLAPDTYTVSITAKGYEDVVLQGVTVVQDQNVQLNQSLSKTLRTIGRVSARNASNLVQPTQTADVYNVSPQQLGAAIGGGGHRTLYDVIQTAPGITSTGVAGRPRIRGSDVSDVAWEFDGIPINDRLTGLFTTNLSVVGTQNLEVYTGGFNAQYGNAAAGVINSVVKRGTYPAFGSVTYTSQFPTSEHDLVAEYGGATPNNRLSWYLSLDRSNSDNSFANGFQPFIDSQALTARDNTPSTIYTRDLIGNFHWRPTDKDDVQLLLQSGNQKLPWNKGLTDAQGILGITACQGVVVSGGKITNPGVSSTGQPCQIPIVTNVPVPVPPGTSPTPPPIPTVTGYANTGLQYYHTTQQQANVWYHWSNLGKIQWNHVVSDKLFMQFRLAENFNQYIFDQPFSLTTINGVTTPGAPYLAGQPLGTQYPVHVTGLAPNGTAAGPGFGYQDEWSDRRSQMYFANLDLTYTANSHATYYGGLSYERDNDNEHYYDNCGCDEVSGGVGAFNNNGTFPNLFLAVDYPLVLPSAYVGTRQTFGKLTVEPSVRYDSETYDIPNRPDVTDPATGKVTKSYAYGPYNTHAFTPRFAFTWAASPYDAIRGSYGVTTSFIPAAYVFNNSPNGVCAGDSRCNSPYYPGENLNDQRNYNVDLSFSHALRNGLDSLRFSPFYRHATGKLELSKLYGVDPATGLVSLSGTSFFRTGIQNRATGAEFGWNHVVRGDGLSSYLSATYVNYWGSVTSGTLAGGTPYGGITSTSFSGQNAALRQFLATGVLFRNPSQPPWSVSWTGDYNRGPYHVQPFVIYQVGAPYNVTGNTCMDQSYNAIGSSTNPCPAALNDSKVHFARANWWAAIDLGYDIYRHNGRTLTLGMNVRNVTNNQFADVYPVVNGAYPKGQNPDLNTYGPGSVPGTLYYYSPDQTPTQYQLYLRTKF
ncbi:MAG TPA: carboxypeptidase regulatory-like domain-containing protein [Candidatus Elarobacter sp.]|nr:carboxypeptidase regulatory-like domain-containing protein [Candidatus Elarobacter sp.]